MNRLILISLSAVLSIPCFSQISFNDQWKKVEIREAFESPDDHKEPATVSYTNPRAGKNSYLINLGVAYTFSENGDKSKLSLAPFFVLNRNTMIEKEQKNWKAGATVNKKWGNLETVKGISKYVTWRTTAEYSRNRADTTNNFFLTSYFFMNYSKVNQETQKPEGMFINAYRHVGKGWFYFVGFTGGPEFQYRFDSPKEINRGEIMRIYYDVGLSFLKKTGTDDSGSPVAEIAISNKGRYAFINTTSKNEGYLPLIKAEFLIYPTGSRSFSIGCSYNTGSDPIAGIEKQDYYLIALKLLK